MADVAEVIHMAQRAIESGDHRRALPLLREAVKLGPASFGAHMMLGICLSITGETTAGRQSLQRAVRLNPTSALGHYNLAMALRAAGRTAEADHHLRESQRCDPGFAPATVALKALRTGSSLGTEFRFPGSPELTSAARGNFPTEIPPPPSPSTTQHPRASARTMSAQKTTAPRRARRRSVSLFALVALTALLGGLGWRLFRPPVGNGAFAWHAPGNFFALDFSPDSMLLACGGEPTMAWKVSSGIPYRGLGWGESAVALAISPDGKTVAVASRDEQTGYNVKLWRIFDSALVGRLPPMAGGKPLAFSPDGALLAVGTDYLGAASPLGVQLWRVKDRQLSRAVATPELEGAGYVTAIAFSAKAKLLATADDAGTIQLFDITSGKRIRTINADRLGNVKLAFTPDGKSLAQAGGAYPTITICSVSNGKVIRTLGEKESARKHGGLPPVVTDVSISPDGTLLAAAESGESKLRVVIYRLSDGHPITSLTGKALMGNSSAPARDDELRAIRFSPDGIYLAWCGSTGVVVAKVEKLVR